MRALTLTLTLLLAACGVGTYRSGFDVEQFRVLEPGKTTKTDVLVLAGPPVVKAQMPDGEAWAYSQSEIKSTAFIFPFYAHVESSGPRTKTAVLIFRGEILERIEWKP